jgi:hypothetical protein
MPSICVSCAPFVPKRPWVEHTEAMNMPKTPPRPNPATPDMAVFVRQLCCISLINFIVFCCTIAHVSKLRENSKVTWAIRLGPCAPRESAPPTICTALVSLGSTFPPVPVMPGKPPPMPGKLMMSRRKGSACLARRPRVVRLSRDRRPADADAIASRGCGGGGFRNKTKLLGCNERRA